MKKIIIGIFFACISFSNIQAQKGETVSKSYNFYIDPNIEMPTEFIQKYVLDSIQIWQKKGRYERTDEYKQRVTEENRKALARELTKNAEKAYITKYYNGTIKFELRDYDADNESFLLNNKVFGDIVVPVARDKAENFEKQFRVDNSKTEYFVEGDIVKIKKIPFISNGEIFWYDNSKSATFAATQINVQLPTLELDLTPDEYQESQQQITQKQITVGRSDVDLNIPSTAKINSDFFAVIIANENYRREAPVPFAINDGRIFRDYCINTLGIPKTQIHLVENATLNDLRHEISWISSVMETQKGKANVIFYYAGHGIPNEATKKAYLLPTDGFSADFSTGYALEDIYVQLGKLPSQSITYFIDACFSGAKREEGMLASARGVSIKVKESILVGNAVAFTAASDEQTAYPYYEKGHGLFTYFLLKKLQETKGEVTYEELANYISEQVSQKSVIVNSKLQSPSVKANSILQDKWKKWTLK